LVLWKGNTGVNSIIEAPCGKLRENEASVIGNGEFLRAAGEAKCACDCIFSKRISGLEVGGTKNANKNYRKNK